MTPPQHSSGTRVSAARRSRRSHSADGGPRGSRLRRRLDFLGRRLDRLRGLAHLAEAALARLVARDGLVQIVLGEIRPQNRGKVQLGVGQARVIVDCHVQVLPADAPVLVRSPGFVAEDPLARLPEATELLGIDVEELARRLALVSPSATGAIVGAGQP